MFEIREDLTKANILSRIDEYSIFRAYCQNFKQVGKPFKSEFYSDSHASCYINMSKGRLYYKDFGESENGINCFDYIMRKFSVTFDKALTIVNNDFNLKLNGPPSTQLSSTPCTLILPKEPITDKVRSSIRVKYRKWTKKDVEFWRNTYGIEKSTLDYYNTRPIKWMTINGTLMTCPDLCYAHLIDIENSTPIYKIYSPTAPKDSKWYTNCLSSNFLGYNQLPWIGDLLIITKSIKDIMVLYQFGYNAIAPQGENVIITKEFMDLLKRRFKRVVIFYDNDGAGIKASNKMSTMYNLQSITLDTVDAKDISDYSKCYGKECAREMMIQLLHEEEHSSDDTDFITFADNMNNQLHGRYIHQRTNSFPKKLEGNGEVPF